MTDADTPVLDLLETMTVASIEASGLDDRTLLLVRLAALVAVDAPPASYLLNLAAASDAGLDVQSARDVLAAVAPIVGSARTVASLGKMASALGLAVELVELAEEEDED